MFTSFFSTKDSTSARKRGERASLDPGIKMCQGPKDVDHHHSTKAIVTISDVGYDIFQTRHHKLSSYFIYT